MADDLLRETFEARLLHLELNRPDKRNALSSALRETIRARFAAAAGDDAVGAVLLSGAGDHFCAGFDLGEVAGSPDPAALFHEAGPYHHAVHTFPKPIVAAVRGAAVAGGFDLALMCDLRVAGTDAVFGQTQVRHGIPAAYELVAQVVGDTVARDLCLTGRTVDASEALRIGLVSRVCEPGDVLETARALAADLAERPGAADTKRRALTLQPDVFG
ncbi:MAG: enoyl-CoA hydratase/isomerase family protein [Actinobacteria bacterium]|nr:enoyl-CoA hydratase/isomerase family protein [Actinomycetota bacterium]NIS35540.1 enoyl-CoA hydratase/isomerase family protein [Actinomycetota bacterium]NIT98179.1 enoyl-CoA hydratase/isomerase family protein [Actinomycetota bacterium]NIU21811.1 enoyl-CoA hydratase/isomerase family protein [Actinomycetota bacterium]NIU70199.1 enoyl-CoA hydratase/isomerase family protein [Actinomycetota bacterium]